MRRRLAFLAALPLLLAPALAPGRAHASEGGKKKGGGESYQQFATLTANIFKADGRRGIFTVECGLDTPDAGLRSRALQLMPRLRDAYATSLQSFANSMRPDGAPDLDLLSRRLQGDTDRILGKPGARLLLGSCLVS